VSDERRDYAILISLGMREEAEVMASALRAEGIDAFVAPLHHATYNWHLTIALGGLQVFVPRQKLQEAKDVIRARIQEAADNPEGESVGRRDRWKVWTVIAGYFAFAGYFYWLSNQEPREFVYAPAGAQRLVPVYFDPPHDLTELEQRLVLDDYCLDNPALSVVSRQDGVASIVPCGDILAAAIDPSLRQ